MKKLKESGLLIGGILGMMNTVFAFEQLPVTPPSGLGSLERAAGRILGAAQWIGFIVGTAMIIYIGIKYLTAGAGQKAEVKSTLVPLLVGAVLVMLAPTIAAWIFGMVG